MRKIGFALLFLATSASAELTNLQRQMMNEPATMMDLFFMRVQAKIDRYIDKEVTLGPTINPFSFDTLDGKEHKINIHTEFLLDENRGKWVFDAQTSIHEDRLSKIINVNLENIKQLCRFMLYKAQKTRLLASDAAHEGPGNKNYNVGNKENTETLNQNLVVRGNVGLYKRNSDGWASINRSVTCEKARMDEDLYSFETFNVTGDWK